MQLKGGDQVKFQTREGGEHTVSLESGACRLAKEWGMQISKGVGHADQKKEWGMKISKGVGHADQ